VNAICSRLFAADRDLKLDAKRGQRQLTNPANLVGFVFWAIAFGATLQTMRNPVHVSGPLRREETARRA